MSDLEPTGQYMYKTSCAACGSSDANAVYTEGNTHCFSCGVTVAAAFKVSNKRKKKEVFSPSFIEYPNSIRAISRQTLEKYTYGISSKKHCTYYYSEQGSIVAEKFRGADKKFSWKGDAKEAQLFGRSVWENKHKNNFIIITEGEIDCMSVHEIYGGRQPVVSLPNGANSAKKDIRKSLEWLLKFDYVVLMFDNDEAGQKAIDSVIDLFPPKGIKVVKLELKDADEMLRANKYQDLKDAVEDSDIAVPESVVTGKNLMLLLKDTAQSESFDLPESFPLLNMKLNGVRGDDLTIITSGSGSGKTTFMKELELHYLLNTDRSIGIIHLEEKTRKTVEGLVSVKLGKKLSKMGDYSKDKEVIKAWKELTTSLDRNNNPKLNIIDAFGTLDTEKLYDLIRYLAKVNECKFIFLDHITMLVSGMGGEINERRALDNIMTTLKSLTQELDVSIIAISHLNNQTNGGAAHEEGGRPTVNNLRGSGALKQLTDNIIALTRNQLADTPEERNKVDIHVLKCRETGDTGLADVVHYNSKTGTFSSDTAFEEPTPF